MDLAEKKIIPQLEIRSNHKPLLFCLLVLTGPHSFATEIYKGNWHKTFKRFFRQTFFWVISNILKMIFGNKICFCSGVEYVLFPVFEHKLFSSFPFVRQYLQHVFNVLLHTSSGSGSERGGPRVILRWKCQCCKTVLDEQSEHSFWPFNAQIYIVSVQKSQSMSSKWKFTF